MKQLFICKEGYKGYKKVKGVPRVVQAILRNNLEDYMCRWKTSFVIYAKNPPPEEYKLPNTLYLEITGNFSLQFDFLALGYGAKVVSEDFLNFLQENGVKDGYEIAKIRSVVNRSDKVLETKPYYVLRFYEVDDDLLEYPVEGAVYATGTKGKKIYPHLTPKQGVEKNIFVLRESPYDESLIFTEEIKDKIIKRKFITPQIYTTQEYIQAYNG
ncbi:hypothetical protein CAPN006_18780 [Capnocytophaga canimorsus]|uniref:Imm43 family immunity protein n=1 Tax=Capnocytophaga canimorsus TaxID=28188 RepID=UPI001AD37EBF|nr:Imm43 family immunity protein [Capnocytophaga canimorsus]GIM57486.1 hypothetical protein CAPN006_18780 [Capnocytophaga canimorsus]